MKSTLRVCLVPALMAFWIFGCSREEPALVPPVYSGWKSTTDQELNYPIPGHEEHYRRIYINAAGEGVNIEDRGGRTYHNYPNGTVIIKDIFKTLDPLPGEAPSGQTVMLKSPGHPQARGGWLWIVKDMQSGQETIIDYEFCFDCHANANEEHPYGDGNPNNEFRDYVFFPFKKQ
jgi:hypothetical protein